jgi:hypothetical protein
MKLQEFPCCVGISEGCVEEIDLDLGIIVTGCCVGVAVHGCVLIYVRYGKPKGEEGLERDLLVTIEEAVRIYDYESGAPVGAN